MFLKYFFTAKRRGFGVHSPFAYELARLIIKINKKNFDFSKIRKIRQNFLHSEAEISVTDLGAGSKKMNSNKRKIRKIAKFSATPHKYGKLLTLLVNHFQPKTILEFGTSLGIGTLYLHLGKPDAKIFTLEGCPQTAEIAKKHLAETSQNIEIIVGNFDETLAKTLKKIGKIDFAFIDGNHRKKPTIRYFEQVLPYCHNNSVLIFDDISWTTEMQEAWQEIKNHPQTTQSINFYKFGLVFLQKELSKQEITLYY